MLAENYIRPIGSQAYCGVCDQTFAMNTNQKMQRHVGSIGHKAMVKLLKLEGAVASKNDLQSLYKKFIKEHQYQKTPEPATATLPS